MSETTGQPMRIAAGRWIRHTFVRENLASALKTFAWLGPLTLLIWVYAERAQVVPVDNVSFPIDVRSDDPNRFVQLGPTFEGNVIAKLRGPRSRIEALRQDIRPSNNKPAVVINIDPKLPAGPNLLDAIKLIGDSEHFRYSGVNITELRPQQLNVFVDTFEEREIDVQAPASVKNLVTTPTFVPAKVKVRAPSSYFQNAGTVTIEADLASAKVLDKLGMQEPVVGVHSPQIAHGPGITYSPSSVKATLEVGASNKEIELSSLPIKLETPTGNLLDQYKVQLEQPAVYGVKVSGPPDKIAEIEQGKTSPYALLKISGSDRPADASSPPKITRAVEIQGLPPGVTVTAAPAPIVFSLVERSGQ